MDEKQLQALIERAVGNVIDKVVITINIVIIIISLSVIAASHLWPRWVP